ncbi:MAG: sulfatase, partial [Elusimicrobiaceae bacterium]|nr:sulfatase [Elusimicrobiaceae bacterium]
MEINKKSKVLKVGSYTLATTLMSMAVAPVAQAIQHDAEFYVVQKQHAKEWKAEDQEIDAKLKALKDKYGKRPNIIHIMWDDTGVGDMGSPLFNK